MNKTKTPDCSFQREYEKYQLRWMIQHGYSLKDLREIFSELMGEYVEECPINVITTAEDALKAFDFVKERFLADTGFNGELFACAEEFKECEYQEIIAEKAATGGRSPSPMKFVAL